jgi:hypothetical protein
MVNEKTGVFRCLLKIFSFDMIVNITASGGIAMPPLVTPAQIRAGRALLGWSQENLATAAEVGLSTLREIEGEKRDADSRAVEAIRRALWNNGVVFLAGTQERGPGVGLAANWPTIVRRPVTTQRFAGMPMTIEWRGRLVTVIISHDALNDLGGFRDFMPDDVYLDLYEKHRGTILRAIAIAIEDPGNFDHSGRLCIEPKDIGEVENADWRRVDINKGDISRIEATELMNKFVGSLIAAGVPPNIEVFHGGNDETGHVYFFSPAAARIAGQLMHEYKAQSCMRPDTGELRKVRL